jgi:acyl-CoA synthetase (AMP-forming)/AMP-acid ligase II
MGDTNPLNVASHLARMATEEPNRPAVHFPIGSVKHDGPSPHRTLTFAELNAKANAYAHGLESLGIARGVRTALMVPPGEEFFALTFALFKVAAVPVLIDPGMGIRNLKKCLAEAEPTAFIGISKAHLARRLFGWGKRTIKTTVNVGRWRFFCTACTSLLAGRASDGEDPSLARPANPIVQADDPAAILFTSGSTGIAKGAEYTHGIFAAQVEILKTTYGIAPGEIDFCTFPLFALFGPALGMTCVVPDMDASKPATIDPRKALSQIKQFGVTNLFGSPAVIRNLSTLADSSRLTTVKRVISAGAPANAAVLERFTKLLPPGVQVFTPYGATEALPIANIGSDEILNETRAMTEQGKGVCVGRPVAGIEVFVVPISDGPIAEWNESLKLPPGEIGEFVIRGPVVTKRYFHRDEATKLAKIVDPRTGEVLHRMGDVGYFDEQGRMWFCGRKSHRVETKDGTFFTDMVEPVFNTLHGVKQTALVGIKRDGITYPLICYMDDFENSGGADEYFMRQRAKEFEHTKNIKAFLLFDSFPMDVRHNSKIYREKLAKFAASWFKTWQTLEFYE